MNPISKTLTILLSILLLTCLMTLLIEPCVAPVTVPNNPISGPEVVSVVVNNYPRYLPPTYETNPYTGETYQTSPGSTDPRGNVTVTIRNQPFTPYTDKNGNNINVYYTCVWKDQQKHPGEWPTLYGVNYAVYQSDSEYTEITFYYGLTRMSELYFGRYDSGGLVDFRIQSVTGYFTPYWEEEIFLGTTVYHPAVYEGEGSAWSEFTVTIPSKDDPESSKPITTLTPVTPPSSGSTNSPSQKPIQYVLIIIVCFVCVVAVLFGVVVYLFRQRKVGSFNDAVRFWEVTNTCQ